MSIELSMYKFADVLQVPLSYKDGKVQGGGKGVFKTSIAGLEIPIHVRVVKMFLNEQCGVLADLIGDLSLLVSHYPKTGVVSAYVIDKGKLIMDGVKTPPDLFFSKNMNLIEVVRSLRRAIVQAWYYKSGAWYPLTIPT